MKIEFEFGLCLDSIRIRTKDMSALSAIRFSDCGNNHRKPMGRFSFAQLVEGKKKANENKNKTKEHSITWTRKEREMVGHNDVVLATSCSAKYTDTCSSELWCCDVL